MKKLIALLFLCSLGAYAQTVTGSSLNFDTTSTSKCKDPTAGQTILCGTGNSVTISFNGSAAVTLPAKGNDGVAATITIGTIAAGAAGTAPKVTNSGTANAAVLNFTIPVGANGTNGVNGATGAPGPQGPAGPAGTATLVNANCSLKFTGAATTDGSVAVTITCQ